MVYPFILQWPIDLTGSTLVLVSRRKASKGFSNIYMQKSGFAVSFTTLSVIQNMVLRLS